MKVPPHVISLYVRTARRYKKLISKINRQPSASYQRKTFIHELRKLLKKLRELQLQLKIAAAAGTVVLLLNSTPVQAQSTLGPFVAHDRRSNPLREPLFNYNESKLTVVDFDKDGDVDAIVGGYDYNGGSIRYYQNQTAQGFPVYLELKDDNNPFYGIVGETHRSAPALADIDGDGDLDLILGQNSSRRVYPYDYPGGIEYHRNDDGVFTLQSGPWNDVTKEGNPFDGITFDEEVTPVFIDFDDDGDQDIMFGAYERIGIYPDYEYQYIHYYNNDGDGNFSELPVTLDTDPTDWDDLINPAFSDVDGDGDYDLLVGNYYDGYLRYYRQDTPGNFIEETGEWDPVEKAGNPFHYLQIGVAASPAFIDFNNDGLLDLFVMDESGYYDYKYSDNIVNYYTNSGNSVFEQVTGEFDNPWDGAKVADKASLVMMDIDGDSDLDAIIGNKYQEYIETYDPELGWIYTQINSFLTQYTRVDEGFEKAEVDPFDDIDIYGNFAPAAGDVDGDNDLDIISADYYGEISFFRNDDDEFNREEELNPFAGIYFPYNSDAELIDIDNDGDLDLFLTNAYSSTTQFYKNIGTSQAPEYEEQLDTSIFPSDLYWDQPYLNFVDLDHDGDQDLVFNGTSPYNVETENIIYYENTGTPETPEFVEALGDLFLGINQEAQVEFVDYDGDGDLDMFGGIGDGTIAYMENQNERVATTITSTIPVYSIETGEAILVEPGLTLADPDNDAIIQATVTIDDYSAGEILAFTPQDDITGSFNAETGVLTFTGKQSVAEYQSILRTVTFQVEHSHGRKRPVKKSTTPKMISFAVYDIDFTNPQIAAKTINLFINTPPVITPEPVSTPAGSTKAINLISITSDPDGNLDHEQFSIISQPTSGADASIEVVSSSVVNLRLDYTGITFKGIDQLTVQACDDAGACAQSVVSVDVEVFAEMVVFNAVAPNSSGDNRFMRILGIPENNKVKIYNRWGDMVFESENYQNTPDGNTFKGNGKSGNPLASGTYYYTIEVPGQKMVSGYLTLKQ